MPRMVTTPWFDHEIPMTQAAELGTQKVIAEHSTIGVVVTTDGTITDIPREDYVEAEERVIDELKTLGKPFVVLLNSAYPQLRAGPEPCARPSAEKYGVTCLCGQLLDAGRGNAEQHHQGRAVRVPHEGDWTSICPAWVDRAALRAPNQKRPVLRHPGGNGPSAAAAGMLTRAVEAMGEREEVSSRIHRKDGHGDRRGHRDAGGAPSPVLRHAVSADAAWKSPMTAT